MLQYHFYMNPSIPLWLVDRISSNCYNIIFTWMYYWYHFYQTLINKFIKCHLKILWKTKVHENFCIPKLLRILYPLFLWCFMWLIPREYAIKYTFSHFINLLLIKLHIWLRQYGIRLLTWHIKKNDPLQKLLLFKFKSRKSNLD